MKKYLPALLTVGLLTTACAQTGSRLAGDAADDQSAEHHVLMAELASQQHDFAEAARQYALALKKTDDPDLAARAGPVVFDYGSYEEALDAALTDAVNRGLSEEDIRKSFESVLRRFKFEEGGKR